MAPPDGTALGRRLRARDLTAAPAVLNLVENRSPAARAQIAALLREVAPRALGGEAPGHVVGVTGPPGRGQVDAALASWCAAWRARRARRSRCSRSTRRPSAAAARCSATARGSPTTRPTRGVFIRSTAAAERLGGLAPATRAAASALAAAFDVVVVETVGVGQSETDVAEVADTRRRRSSSPAPATRCSS